MEIFLNGLSSEFHDLYGEVVFQSGEFPFSSRAEGLLDGYFGSETVRNNVLTCALLQEIVVAMLFAQFEDSVTILEGESSSDWRQPGEVTLNVGVVMAVFDITRHIGTNQDTMGE